MADQLIRAHRLSEVHDGLSLNPVLTDIRRKQSIHILELDCFVGGVNSVSVIMVVVAHLAI